MLPTWIGSNIFWFQVGKLPFVYWCTIICQPSWPVQQTCVQLTHVQLTRVQLTRVHLTCVQLTCVQLACVQLTRVQLTHVQLTCVQLTCSVDMCSVDTCSVDTCSVDTCSVDKVSASGQSVAFCMWRTAVCSVFCLQYVTQGKAWWNVSHVVKYKDVWRRGTFYIAFRQLAVLQFFVLWLALLL